MPGGKPARLSLDRDEKFDLFGELWFAKPAHAELVLMRCRDDFREIGAARAGGWVDLPAREVRDKVVIVSAFLGAKFFTAEEIRRNAAAAVQAVLVRVEEMRRTGGLAELNASYKIHRQRQTARGEKVIPYSLHLAAYKRSLVALAARNAG